jgi:hypothetical protein
MQPALDPAGHWVPRMKPTCLLYTWRPHRRRPFTLVLHLHQHQSSRNLHLQYLAKNQSTQHCQSLITQGSDHPPVLEPHMILKHGDDEDGDVVPPVEHVPTTSTTVVDGPSPTPTTTNPYRGEATVEGEVASRREPPRRVQVDHPASRIIGDMNERTTRSRVRNNFHFTHAAFVATFEPKDIGHALFDHNWVNQCMRSWRTLRGIRFGNC